MQRTCRQGLVKPEQLGDTWLNHQRCRFGNLEQRQPTMKKHMAVGVIGDNEA
jgi:hypothetical protein